MYSGYIVNRSSETTGETEAIWLRRSENAERSATVQYRNYTPSTNVADDVTATVPPMCAFKATAGVAEAIQSNCRECEFHSLLSPDVTPSG